MPYRWSLPMALVLLRATPALAEDVALTFAAAPAKTAAPTPATSNGAVSLSFTPKPAHSPRPPAPVTQVVRRALETLFHGNSDSLVARAVGSAEGTRTAEGGYTAAYYGHVDPGNHKWNLGSFSYQHGANSPTEADAKQLKWLYNQILELRR